MWVTRERIFQLQLLFFLESACSETLKKHGFKIIGSFWTKLIALFFPLFIIKTGFQFWGLDLPILCWDKDQLFIWTIFFDDCDFFLKPKVIYHLWESVISYYELWVLGSGEKTKRQDAVSCFDLRIHFFLLTYVYMTFLLKRTMKEGGKTKL
jgi:hypothetical protein